MSFSADGITAPSNLVLGFGLTILALQLALLIECTAIARLLTGRRQTAKSRAAATPARQTRPLPPRPGGPHAPIAFGLVVRAGGPIGLEFPLGSLNMYVGADPRLVDIVLSDDYVSGRHAAIQREGDELFVTDLDSSNGTYVNDMALLPYVRAALAPGDRINIGGLTLECVRRHQPARAEARSATPGEPGSRDNSNSMRERPSL